jgi:hypothetical protein
VNAAHLDEDGVLPERARHALVLEREEHGVA